jgi:hypothetical protein
MPLPRPPLVLHCKVRFWRIATWLVVVGDVGEAIKHAPDFKAQSVTLMHSLAANTAP